MVSMTRGRKGGNGKRKAEDEEDDGGEKYAEARALRIKENMERMKSLGITDLSKQLKRRRTPSLPKPKVPKPARVPSNDPPRRSSRLKELPRVSYTEREKKIPKKDSSSASCPKVEIHIPEGENPEIYTDEHEKLLGDSIAPWTLYVDGFDEDGQRIYDPHEGKSCHQCRQKTLGLRTECSKCKTGAGQFCGDCLYMRYGENVTEVNLNQDWVCPACRGICNCSRCRRDKGWNPTGAIYNKAASLGFKSVAHYLIYTLREGAIEEAGAAEGSTSSGGSNTVDEKEESSDAQPQSGGEEHEISEDIIELEVDDDDEGDDGEDH